MRKFKQILKILFKILKVFVRFKENVNKNLEKLTENYNFLLLSILIAGWGLGCSPSFANFAGFRGEASPFPTGYVTDWHNKIIAFIF